MAGVWTHDLLIHDLIRKHDELDRSTTAADYHSLFHQICVQLKLNIETVLFHQICALLKLNIETVFFVIKGDKIYFALSFKNFHPILRFESEHCSNKRTTYSLRNYTKLFLCSLFEY